MNGNGLSGQGILMIVIGLWLILRTVNKDSTGRTLIDHITGTPASQSVAGINLGPVSTVNSWLGQQLTHPFQIQPYNLGPVSKVNSAIGHFVTGTAPNAIASGASAAYNNTLGRVIP